MSQIQRLAIAYGMLFFAIVGVGYVPAFNDAAGNLFGLFSLQWYDDVLHAFSGLWALVAAFMSHAASVFYFRLFGTVYLFDGLLGLVTGSGCLDGGIFIDGFRPLSDVEMPVRFFANLPHITIGGLAVLIGFWLAARRRPAIA